MQTFVEKVADNVLLKYGSQTGELTVVFPNRRAGVFFREALARQAQGVLWSPRILAFEDFIRELSPLQCADQLTLVYTLYDVFQHITRRGESLDQFYHWGTMLLHDFSEIDHALVNDRDLFSNIRDIKELEAHFDYLTEEQLEAITRFWKNFAPSAAFSGAKAQFINLWSRLHEVYTAFGEKLRQQGLAYEGMIAREVAQAASQHQLTHHFGQLVFAGFNAFTPAEETIVSWFVGEQADIFWDVDALYVADKQQEAGTFFRKYSNHKVFGSTFEQPLPSHFTTEVAKKMHLIATTLEVGQAKKLGELLETLSQDKAFNPEKTVVVLPDEHLLFPVLHSLPDTIRRINVTMGYPLRKTPLYSLMEDLLTLQEDKRYNPASQQYEYHHTSVLSILKHPYLVQYQPELSFENVQRLSRENQVYIRKDRLHGDHALYPLIFRPVTEVDGMFDYLRNILTQIHDLVHEEEKATDETSGEEIILPNLEQELIYHFYIQLNRLKSIAEEHQLVLTTPVFMKLFRQVLPQVRVPFTGEPLRGLQVMGVLETRNLDFEHVFILSMNEGIYPPAESTSSFIPGSLRKGFGLPTQDRQDAVYAYTFFRLLQKARHVYCFYNTEAQPQLSGEPSRFLYQLMYESERLPGGVLRYPERQGNMIITQQTLALPVQAIPAPPLHVLKSEAVKRKLFQYLKRADNDYIRLTPSALNTYLDCRLKFYFKYVAEMKEVETLQADIDPATFGSILHKAMEVVYANYMQEHQTAVVEPQVCLSLKGRPLEKAISFAFRDHFQIEEDQGFTFEGKNLIAREIITKMANRILDLDAAYAPFEILGLEEKEYYLDLSVPDIQGKPRTVPLRGIVDRIDRKGQTIRVLDYKTGRDEKQIKDIPSLFNRDEPQRNKAAMQAMFYALLYYENQNKQEQVVPGLINARNIFEDPFDPRFMLQKNTVNDFSIYESDFIQHLTGLLQELFDETVPFDQTDDESKCGFCPYASICY